MVEVLVRIRFAVLGAGFAMVLPPFNWPPYLVLFLMIPLIDDARNSRIGLRLVSGVFFGLGFFLVLLKWLIVVGSDALLALSFICALWWALSNALSQFFFSSKYWVFWFACSWTALEILRDRLPWGGFGWGQLGIIWTETPFAGLYSTFGQIGMTFTTYLAIAYIYLHLRVRKTRFNVRFVSSVAISISLIIGISFVSHNFQPIVQHEKEKISIGAIQGGVANTGLGTLGPPRAVLNKHITETQNHLQTVNKLDLLVWPESSVDLDPYSDATTLASLLEIDLLVSPPILLGTTLYSDEGLKQNTSLLLRNETLQWVYQKRHLVPFGEFLPLRGVIARYTDRASLLSTDYESGTKAGSVSIENLSLGVIICFEVADVSLVHENIGSYSALLIQTNNATYQHLGQSEQQTAYNRVRALETKRPVLSVSTSGISQIVNSDGEVVQQISQDETGMMSFEVEKISGLTIASRTLEVQITLILLGFFSGIALLVFRRFGMLT